MNVKKIKQSEAVKQNGPGVHSEMVAEENIEIGGTAAEKKHLAVRIDPGYPAEGPASAGFSLPAPAMVRMSD